MAGRNKPTKCKCCGKEELFEHYPLCKECLIKLKQWGEPKWKSLIYYYEHKQDYNNRAKEYQKNNREKINQYHRNRTARIKELENTVAQLKQRVKELEQQLAVDKSNI